MSNLFDDFEFDEDEPATAPAWLRDLDDDKEEGTTSAAATSAAAPAARNTGLDLDRLREKSARAGAMDDEMGADAAAVRDNNGEGGFLSRMSPAQRLIIAIFFLVDLCVVGVGVLLLVGAI